MGAAMSAAHPGAGGFDAGFVQPMGKDGFGMGGSPAIGQQFVQPWVIRMQARQEVSHASAPWLDPTCHPIQGVRPTSHPLRTALLAERPRSGRLGDALDLVQRASELLAGGTFLGVLSTI